VTKLDAGFAIRRYLGDCSAVLIELDMRPLSLHDFYPHQMAFRTNAQALMSVFSIAKAGESSDDSR
jgi:hypothetical protein